MHSLREPYLNSLTFTAKQSSTMGAIWRYRGKQELYVQQKPEILETLKQVAFIESEECSNRIEGVTAPRQRIEALTIKATTPRDRNEQEIAGYRDALNLIHESAEHMDVSVNIIKQLHAYVFRHYPDPTAGQWKPGENHIVERNPDGSIGRVRFQTVSAFETPSAMEELVNLYSFESNESAAQPLVLIPLFVFDFLCIHPFREGNGRVARLLTLLLLYRAGFEVGKYISLERVIEESKVTYYECLEASSQKWHQGEHDIFPWLNYFWGTLIRAYKEFEDRLGAVKPGKGSKTNQIRDAVNRRFGPFAISDIEMDCPNISRDMIRLVLRKLKEEGLIQLKGKGRGAKWLRKT